MIGPFNLTFYVFANGNTSVYDEAWNEICPAGGVACLDAFIAENTPTQYDIEGETYYIFPNEMVVDANGKIICETGGVPCLEAWLNDPSRGAEKVVVTQDGVDYIFYVFPDGKVTDDKGNIICKTGGRPCLDAWLLEYKQYLGAYDQIIY